MGSLRSQKTTSDQVSIFDTSQSLEEGLAAYNEKNVIEPLAAQMFPGGKKIRDEKASTVGSRLQISPNEVAIIKVDSETGNIIAQRSTYQDSRKLVEFLINEVPNFEFLAEKARHGSSLDELAVVVDETLGIGTYSELTHTVEATASRYLNKINILNK